MSAASDTEPEVLSATWSLAFMYACVAGLILITRGIWETIQGLYFPYAWHVMVLPLILLPALTLTGKYRNTNKIAALFSVFLLMFTPAAYLYFSGSLDGHSLVFSNFDNSLDHMPYAQYLPILYFAVLMAPIRTRANVKET